MGLYGLPPTVPEGPRPGTGRTNEGASQPATDLFGYRSSVSRSRVKLSGVDADEGSSGALDALPIPRGGIYRTGRRLRRSVLGLRDLWEIRSDDSYRRLASTYELPDGSRRIYCHHVRKTAGTSLHLSFMALGGEEPLDVYRRMADTRLHRTISGDYSFAAFHRRVLAEGAYFYGRSHAPVARQPLPARTFTVTVLRDPVERAHSYFDYLVAGDDPTTPGRPVGPYERQVAQDGFDAFLDASRPNTSWPNWSRSPSSSTYPRPRTGSPPAPTCSSPSTTPVDCPHWPSSSICHLPSTGPVSPANGRPSPTNRPSGSGHGWSLNTSCSVASRRAGSAESDRPHRVDRATLRCNRRRRHGSTSARAGRGRGFSRRPSR